MTEKTMRFYIKKCILRRLSGEGDRRNEALRDVIGLAAPDISDEALARIAALIPELPGSLYEKWTGMFADRLLETVPHAQIAELCSGTEENDAALRLVYAMFMESERMEKTVAEDLRQLAAQGGVQPDDAALASFWLKAKMGGAGSGAASH